MSLIYYSVATEPDMRLTKDAPISDMQVNMKNFLNRLTDFKLKVESGI